MQPIAQATAILLAGASLGWIMLFSFVLSPVAFKTFDQGRAELDDSRSVLEEVAGDNDFVMLPDGKAHVRTFLRRMLFDDRFADAKVGTLSGGERNRVQLAKLLRQGGNVILLDEPTNDLDLFTLGVLEEALGIKAKIRFAPKPAAVRPQPSRSRR